MRRLGQGPPTAPPCAVGGRDGGRRSCRQGYPGGPFWLPARGTAEPLIATDVAARGLDVEQLTHVVNDNVPSDPAAYVHRIGRVGRAGREGVAITLTEPREHRMLKAIERTTRKRIEVEQLPTLADLRARRMELTRAGLRESILDEEEDLERFRAVIEPLAEEFDLMEIALAAAKLAHESSGAAADEEEAGM